MVGASIFSSQAPCPQVDSYVPLTYVLRSPASQESQARCHMPLAATQVVPVTPSTWRWLRKRALGPSLGTWLAQLPQVQHDFHQFPYPGVSSVKLQAVPSFIGFHRYMVADDSEDCQPAFMKLDLKKQLLGWWGPQGGPWDPSCPEVWSCNDPGGGWGLGLKWWYFWVILDLGCMYSYSDGTKPVQVHCEQAFVLMVLFFFDCQS